MQTADWYLSPQTHLAFLGVDLVVLDVAENAYFCLPQAGNAMRQVDDGRLDFDDIDLAEQFAAAELITRTPAGARAPLPARPTADLQAIVVRPVRHGERTAMARAFIHMLRHYYGRPFLHLVTQAQRGSRDTDDTTPSPAVVQRAASFAHLLPWTPFQGECLYRSFMLLRFLRMAGHDARWVFGVQTWPFQAHCWLQVGDTVLDDAADRVAPFTPIFAV